MRRLCDYYQKHSNLEESKNPDIQHDLGCPFIIQADRREHDIYYDCIV